MSDYTQERIDGLIDCQKRIIEPPKKQFVKLSGHQRNDMKAEGPNGERFGVFMRVSEKFEEDFSIGLRYDPPDGSSLILVRCNGPHGDVVNQVNGPAHFGFHIHRATIENIDEGRRAEAGATLTLEYASYKQALRYFLQISHIQWTETEFPRLRTLELFDDQ